MNIAALRRRYRGVQEPLRSERRLELLLIALASVVALQLMAFAWRYAGGRPTPSIAPVEDSLLVAKRLGPGSVSAAQSRMLQARPVFWASRRPVPEVRLSDEERAAMETAVDAEALEDFALTGVVVAGAQGQALVTHKGTALRLAIGEAVEGWTLTEVMPDAAVLVSAREREVYTLAPVAIPEGAISEGFIPEGMPEGMAEGESMTEVPSGQPDPAPSDIAEARKKAKTDDSFSLGN